MHETVKLLKSFYICTIGDTRASTENISAILIKCLMSDEWRYMHIIKYQIFHVYKGLSVKTVEQSLVNGGNIQVSLDD